MMNIAEDEKNITNFESIKEKGLIIGFSEPELISLIRFFSKAGAILDFQDVIRSKNRIDNIVLKPKFLLESLGKFVYDEKYHKDTIKNTGISQKLVFLNKIYKKYGILGDTIFHKALFKIGVSERELHFLQNLCTRMMIFSPIHALPEKIKMKANQKKLCNFYFLVPSMIPVETQCEDLNTFFGGNDNLCKGNVQWEADVPQSLYTKVVTSFIFFARFREGLKVINISTHVTQIEFRKVRISLEYDTEKQINVIIGTKAKKAVEIVEMTFYKIKNSLKTLYPNSLSFAENMKIEFQSEESKDEKNIKEKAQEEVDEKYDCFLSYSWGPNNVTHNQVIEYSEALKNRGFNVLIDDKGLAELDSERILKKVNSCPVFVAFLTTEYVKNSKDRRTIVYDELKRRIHCKKSIFVVLDKSLVTSIAKKGTAVASLVENELVINFATRDKKENIRKNMDKLCNQLKSLS